MLKLKLRHATAGDINFILKSWLRTSKVLNPEIPDTMFYREKEKEIKDAIASELVEFQIYHPEGDEDTILGFIVYTPLKQANILHFIYVKKDLRRQGFASNMVEAVGDVHVTTEKPPKWYDIPYNPMLWKKVVV